MGIYSILAIIVICIGINVIYKNFLVLRKPERPQYIRINFGNVHKSNTHFISSMLILGFIPFLVIGIFLLKMELFSIIYPLNKTPEQVISDLKSDVRTQNMINFASQFTTSNTLLTSIQKKPFVGKAIIVKDGVFRKDLMDLLPIEIVARDTSEIETIILLESKKNYLLVKDAENKVDTLFLEKVKMSYIQNYEKFIYYNHEYTASPTGKKYSKMKYEFIIYELITNDMYAISDTIN